jgi:polyphosphate glucokinase
MEHAHDSPAGDGHRDHRALGVDIGGTAIKAGVVDTATGEVLDREVVPTPQPATPPAVAATVRDIAARFDCPGTFGVAFPAIIKDGVSRSAANVDPAWVSAPARDLFAGATGRHVVVLNDADAAGLAEVRFGAGRGQRGVVLLLTFGTGIGSALFIDGRLVPNTELGHVELDGVDAEDRAAESARANENLSWAEWAGRVRRYLGFLERLFTPNLFIVGGGVSKQADRWVPLLDLTTPVVPAVLRNNAGLVGAAMAATGEVPAP